MNNNWINTNEYSEYLNKTKDYSDDKMNSLKIDMNKIFEEFADNMNNNIEYNSNETLELVKKLQDFITSNFYKCSNDILLYLGELYINDERFKANIDIHGDNNSLYINKAIKYYCSKY